MLKSKYKISLFNLKSFSPFRISSIKLCRLSSTGGSSGGGGGAAGAEGAGGGALTGMGGAFKVTPDFI